MCGIVGYVGDEPVVPVLLRGLEDMEYRGYDSAGVGFSGKDGLVVVKTLGTWHNLQAPLLVHREALGAGIGHTRWVTHGGNTVENAHPHVDCQNRYAVVHNGIIDNYELLKDGLISRGHVFTSKTDTEVIAHLLEECSGGLLQKVLLVMERLVGAFAFIVIAVDEAGSRLVAGCHDIPLWVGVGGHAYQLASEEDAFCDSVQHVAIVPAVCVVDVSLAGVIAYDTDGEVLSLSLQPRRDGYLDNSKQGYAHFMLKEIFEQPRAMRRLLGEFDWSLRDDYVDLSVTKIVGMGSAFYAGECFAAFCKSLGIVPPEVLYAADCTRVDFALAELCVAVSQSGGTFDTLSAVRLAKELGVRVTGVINREGSALGQLADVVFPLYAGPERAVASTKSFLAQIVCLCLVLLPLGVALRIWKQLGDLPGLLEDLLLHAEKNVQESILDLKDCEHLYILGRGLLFPVVREMALKCKEVACVHAEAIHTAEFKHGPLALVTLDTPVIVLLAADEWLDKNLLSVHELAGRGARVFAVAEQGICVPDVYRTLYLPRGSGIMTQLVFVVFAQVFAYYLGLERGCDIDQPQNLAKCVTVG